MKKIVVIIVLVIGAFFLGKSLTQPKPCGAVCGAQITTVGPQDFSQRSTQQNVIILDVRTSEEYAQGHIQNAVNIDFNNTPQFEASLNSLDKTKTYLIYCRTGHRSGQALQMMENKGFTNIVNLNGGIQAWQSAGLSLTK